MLQDLISCLNKFDYPTDDVIMKAKQFMQKSRVHCTNKKEC